MSVKSLHRAIRCKASAGVGMVEVLVALVVLSVGMLGIAGLYVSTLRASNGAIYRTLAVSLAADMADRIRANPRAGDAYEGDAEDNGCADTNADDAADCSRTAMAADDLFRWRQEIAAALPDDGDPDTLQGIVAVDGGPLLRTYTITINWEEPSEPLGMAYTLRMQI
jgi:type IV pilus assembly protein PilV